MTVTVYNSTDAGAPVLAGIAGSLIGVLDACLVNGYGSQTAAGWTKPFAGTNRAVYRQGTGNLMYLDVNEATTGSHARVYGVETSTGIGTGGARFPAETAFPGGLYFLKSNALTADPRAWTIIATTKAFYLWVSVVNELQPYLYSSLVFFGDIVSNKANDQYDTMLIGNTGTPYNGNTMLNLSTLNLQTPGHYIARSFTQVGGSVQVGKHSDSMRGKEDYLGMGNIPFPNPIDGSIVLAPVWIHEANNTSYPIRGTLPGFWNVCHLAPFSHGNRFFGNGNMAGKEFMAINMYFNTASVSQCAIEVSDTW